MDPEKLKEFKKNFKTAYLAEHFERILEEEATIESTAKKDPSLKELAEEELVSLREQKDTLWKQMEDITVEVKKEEQFPNKIILEVRAGAGGEEAALFAEQLARMYERYATKKNWSFKNTDESLSTLGGFKEGVFEIEGKGVYKDLRFETGVHRVQRIPATEKQGRVHTSTASVVI